MSTAYVQSPLFATEKRCPKCERMLPLDAYHRCKRNRLGVAVYCKECIVAVNAYYRVKRADVEREYRREYYLSHREQLREYGARHYRENTEYVKERDRAYRVANVERRRDLNRAYREENADTLNEYCRQWRRENAPRANQYKKNRRARIANANVNDFTPTQWESMLAYYDFRCGYCGASLKPPTQDHMQPLSRGGDHTESNIVPCCARCNSRKHDKTLVEFLAYMC